MPAGLVTNAAHMLKIALTGYESEKEHDPTVMQAEMGRYRYSPYIVYPETDHLYEPEITAYVDDADAVFDYGLFFEWLEAQQEQGYYTSLKVVDISYKEGSNLIREFNANVSRDDWYEHALEVAKAVGIISSEALAAANDDEPDLIARAAPAKKSNPFDDFYNKLDLGWERKDKTQR